MVLASAAFLVGSSASAGGEARNGESARGEEDAPASERDTGVAPVAEISPTGVEQAVEIADEVGPTEGEVAGVAASVAVGAPDQRAAIAIAAALAQIGLPYVWGGNGPTAGHAGFDCSGLTTFAYAAAGIRLPRTAHTQYYAGPAVASGEELRAGDLVFYGTPARVHHVGMYLGDGVMVNAPTFGKPVQTASYRWRGDDYLGATRPAADATTPATLSAITPPAPQQPPAQAAPAEFLAPPMPLPAQPSDPLLTDSAQVPVGLPPAPAADVEPAPTISTTPQPPVTDPTTAPTSIPPVAPTGPTPTPITTPSASTSSPPPSPTPPPTSVATPTQTSPSASTTGTAGERQPVASVPTGPASPAASTTSPPASSPGRRPAEPSDVPVAAHTESNPAETVVSP